METTTTAVVPATHVQPDTAPSDIVTVFNWNGQHYAGDHSNCPAFLMEINDQRQSNGQLYVDIASADGSTEDVMSLIVEISSLPGSSSAVQTAHVAFDADNMAFSLFKQGDSYILRPEVGVALRPTVLADGTHAFILK